MSDYISPEERVWNRMKTVAAELARKGRTVNAHDASAIVDGIVFEEHARDVIPEAHRYFVREFQRMVSRYAADGTATLQER